MKNITTFYEDLLYEESHRRRSGLEVNKIKEWKRISRITHSECYNQELPKI